VRNICVEIDSIQTHLIGYVDGREINANEADDD
jgi:hypothetical protein